MLRTLLESRSGRSRNEFGTTASVTIHFILIVLAAFATAASAPPESERESPTVLHWVTPRPVASRPFTHSITRALSDAPGPVRPPSISLAISTNIPDVNIPLGAVRHDEFAAEVSSATDAGESVSGNSGVEKPAYDAYEVDRAVQQLSGVTPVYPAAMRAAGIEGEVEAQFIVNDRGAAEVSSLRIVSSTNDQFAESVRRALPKMRFVPAQLEGRPVAQTVQQLFSFRLSR
jgi:TonB family protein